MRLSRKLTLVVSVAAVTTATAMLGVQAGAVSGDRAKPAPTASAKPDPRLLAKEKAAARSAADNPASRAALATMSKRVTTYVAKHGTKYTFAVYTDPATGSVVLDSSAPARVVSRLTQAAGDRSLRSVNVRTKNSKIRDLFNRRDDIPSFWGGAGISAGGTCSTGYAVQNVFGTRYMTTAGHCYADGTVVRTESLANVMGTVFGRQLPTVNGQPKDMELMFGGSYSGRTYNGGVFSTTSNPVVAAGGAFVGYNNYCHSGRTTGENCGHTATSTNSTVCTSTGCKTGLISFTGGVLPQPGDSGSPFYAKDASGGVYIRGHVIAGGGGVAWAEAWTKVASTYGVSIVTG
ncbi:MAG: hypothetical protein ACRCYU_18165 [Nocardioides sp.]